ncbi:NAD(P)/FAD-dependent oxidoreductase [Streptomyces sp. NPDC005808]|uniref:NAD(P)/FAD-dependent oxidoreductase n=1 Tax=Streptomyces sp. NPDC005808 TaxID=3364734 RepID=UPI0036A56579
MSAGTRTAVDVAVVGAGVIGCMTAREILTRNPDASVMVLDRDIIASGATQRSAGLHFPRGATERVRSMSAFSQDYYARLLEDHPEAPIHPLPMTVIADEAREQSLRKVHLESADLRRVPHAPHDWIRIPNGSVAWQGNGCQYADVAQLTHRLMRSMRERISLRESVQVMDVQPQKEAVELRLGNGDTVEASCVVLAPGPWLLAPAWRNLVAPLGIRVKKVVAMHVDVRPEKDDHAVVFYDEDAFLLPLHDRGHWLFSYTCQEWDVDPDTVANGLSPENLREAKTLLAHYAPELVGRCASGRVFCDAYSPTKEPVVATLDEHHRVVFAGAANGSGYRLAPAVAAEAVGLLPLPHYATGNQT